MSRNVCKALSAHFHLCSMAVRTEKEHLLNALNWAISDGGFQACADLDREQAGS
jgi:hypothetical protein